MPCHVLQPGSSCFTLTRRICQLMASDKSSEAPVHTFRRCKHTCAREPLAKHLHRARFSTVTTKWHHSKTCQRPNISKLSLYMLPKCCLSVPFKTLKVEQLHFTLAIYVKPNNSSGQDYPLVIKRGNREIMGNPYTMEVFSSENHPYNHILYNLNGWFSFAEVSNRIWFPFQPPFSAVILSRCLAPSPPAAPSRPVQLGTFRIWNLGKCVVWIT